ncbi:MAG TPA: OmpA family protein [Povalibacter sp.]|uniref:OmpA family protein n=1 Tax=Povalibacter sp. TaxID=1962978 RepID=UPI002CC5BE99|nr:OmpA family protein [Povalibacter sp.]HMN45398.1 OmpA family protein [Povalibacter sp.]
MRFRNVVSVVSSAAVLAVLCFFLWAWFGPQPACADPACARQRFALDLELDRFERVEPMELQVATPDGEVSVASVIGSGGIDVRVRPQARDLPLAANEKLDRADLYAYAQEWRTRTPQAGADAHLYAMLAPAIVSDSGEALFGLMFDAADRTGFAVAPAEIMRRFSEHEPDAVSLLQLRTFIHEMLHALNRRHGQAVQMPDERLTIEAPTRCISDHTNRQHWTLREQPLMSLSPSTIEFFQSAPASRVLPGPGNSPFLVGSPSTCGDVRAAIVVPPQTPRWRLAMLRFRGLLGFPQAQAAETDEEAEAADEIAPPDVSVTLQAMTAPYPLGYPVAIRVIAINRGERTLPLVGRLTPGYGLLTIEVRRADGGDWNTIEPIAWFDPIDDAQAMLAPGERTEQTVPIFFDKDAWTFPVAGEYEVRARLNLGEDVAAVVAEPVIVRVTAPDTDIDVEALRLISDAEGHLRNDIGRLLLMQGRVPDLQGDDVIGKLTEHYAETALGVAVQLTQASRLLRRPIDPKTGQRPRPDLAAARELLADSCSDSGVAALRGQLLDFHEDTTGAQAAPAMEEPTEAAWDGAVPRGSPAVATYSDPALRAAARIFRFCAGDTELHGRAAGEATQFARRLRQLQPERVVVVGHSDRAGTCRSNDVMAMRRAESLRDVLVRAGFERRQIEIVSLGKRRPEDFSSSAQADALNRRVEILVPTALADELDEAMPANDRLPDCPAGNPLDLPDKASP